MPKVSHERLLVGIDTLDDAGVYKLSDELALIQTVDFFTPIVDDPFDFGQIAAANAMSDVYAMGGRPITALNMVCFPVKTLELGILEQILMGGAEKVAEAGALLVGGHTVDDPEPKYGLAVTGVVDPARLITNAGAGPGDDLVLTKPLGTGIITTALKTGLAGEKEVKEAVRTMKELNRPAAEAMQEVGAKGATDITGFGLLGHACQFAKASGVSLHIDSSRIPLLPKVIEFAEQGAVPGGAMNNMRHFAPAVSFGPGVPPPIRTILFDPQTSGGLLISIPKARSDELLRLLESKGVRGTARIGHVEGGIRGTITVD